MPPPLVYELRIYHAQLDVVLRRAAMSSPLRALTRGRCSRLGADETKSKGIQEIIFINTAEKQE